MGQQPSKIQIIHSPLNVSRQVLRHLGRINLRAHIGRVDGGLLSAQLARHDRRARQQVRLFLAALRGGPLGGRRTLLRGLKVHAPGEDLAGQVVHIVLVRGGGGGGGLVHDQVIHVHLI